MTKPTCLSRAALIAGAALTLSLGACAGAMNDDAPSMSLSQSSSARTSSTPATPSSSAAATAQAAQAATTQATPATPPAEPATGGAATGAASVGYTDAQLRSFIAASVAIQQAQPAAGVQPTPDQVAQIRTALESNGLDRDTYNAIAQRMRSDAAFNARVEALRTASGGASASSATTPPSN